MELFYFTYGTEGQPFSGGWTEIEAPDEDTARAVFRLIHPKNGFLNCSSVYPEERFKRTKMAGPGGNFGRFCQEKITLQVTQVCCLKYLGRDSSSRPVYEQEDGTIWKDRDARESSPPMLCTSVNNAFDGEPCDPMRIMTRFKDVEIRFIPRRDTWENPINN